MVRVPHLSLHLVVSCMAKLCCCYIVKQSQLSINRPRRGNANQIKLDSYRTRLLLLFPGNVLSVFNKKRLRLV